MKFLLVSKKEKFDSKMINESFLSSVNSPSLIAEKFLKLEISNFDIYLYLYNQITEEKEGTCYKIDSEKINFFNGIIAANNDEKFDIDKIYQKINDDELILGDYQFVHINSEGNGIIKTPDSSLYPLFYYEDEFCFVLSNEIKLIVDGVETFNDSFVNYFDETFIHEVYHLGFFYNGKRDGIRNTVFKNIKKILPQDEVKIINGKITIEKNDSITVPEWFEKWYFEDKEGLYDWYYEKLIEYTDSMISSISNNLNQITVGITGGFDSRLTLMVLEKFCKKYDIPLKSSTDGQTNHPDVKLGEKVSNALKIPWTHHYYKTEDSLKPLPQNLRDYAATFYQSQGDFDSHDFLPDYSREIKNTGNFYQKGMDLYKRDNIYKLINFNRWSSRRRLSTSDFYFPLFGTNLELWFAMLYAKHFPKQEKYTEFIYNVIKRGNPQLLEIPFAFKSLPQTNVKEYETEEFNTTLHDPQPFLWDYEFVLTELKPFLKIKFDKIDSKFNNILSESEINHLDYFLLDKKIDEILSKYSSESSDKTRKKLMKLKAKSFYPKSRIHLKINIQEKNYMKKRSLMKLMDYASSASFTSFESIENYFKSENYDSKEEIYKKFDVNVNNNLELLKQLKSLKKENEKLKKDMNELTASNSWKITKPLRKIKSMKK